MYFCRLTFFESLVSAIEAIRRAIQNGQERLRQLARRYRGRLIIRLLGGFILDNLRHLRSAAASMSVPAGLLARMTIPDGTCVTPDGIPGGKSISTACPMV